MNCPKCNGPMITCRVNNEPACFCYPCQHMEMAAHAVSASTPIGIPVQPQKAPEVNVVAVRPIPVKRSKYGNVKTERYGVLFDSKKEADTYEMLCSRQAAGEIHYLARQVKFTCVVSGIKICDYFADFSYEEKDCHVIVDVKSPASKTAVYRLKKKLMWACHAIEVVEM